MLNQSSSRHVIAHFCGYAALQVRGRLDTPPAVHCLPSPSARQSFQPGLRHPGPFVQPRSKLHKRLGCICVLPVKPFPLEGWEPWVQVHAFGMEQPSEKAQQDPRGMYQSRTWPPLAHSHVPTSPSLQRLTPPRAQHSLQTSSPEGITPQPAAWLPQERWEPCHQDQLPTGQLTAGCSYRWRETWD